MNIFNIKKQDTLPALSVTLQQADGTAINLTGGSIFFHMGNLITYAPHFSGAGVITDATAGEVEYRWTGSPDTFTTGNFWGEFEVTWTGSQITLPNDHSLKINIFEDYEG